MLGNAQFAHHVKGPDDVGFFLGNYRFFLERPIIFIVMEPFGVEAQDFATTGNEPKSLAFYEWSTANALQRPVMNATGRQLFARMLPQEFTV